MKTAVAQAALDQAFFQARSVNKFTEEKVSDELLKELYETVKWGPTGLNAQPARYIFVKSPEAKARLVPALMAGNVEKTKAAPATVIVAYDKKFFDHLPTLFPAYDAKPMYEANPALALSTAQLNSHLQGAYLIIAARMLGLDAGPMAGFDAAKVDAEFFPDGKWATAFLVNLGYGDHSGNYPRGVRLPFETVAKIL